MFNVTISFIKNGSPVDEELIYKTSDLVDAMSIANKLHELSNIPHCVRIYSDYEDYIPSDKKITHVDCYLQKLP